MKDLIFLICCMCLATLSFSQNLTVEGKIGIGIDPPVYKLDILSDDFTSIHVFGNSPAGAVTTYTDGADSVAVGLGNSGDLIFRNGNNTDARITDDGHFVLENGRRFGINIDNPGSYFQLQNTGLNTTDYSMWVASGFGLFKMNKWAHLHFQNFNGSTTNFWHVGHRDDDSFDIAYGKEVSTVVSQADALFRMLPNGNGIFRKKVTIGSDNEAESFAGLRMDDDLDITMHGDGTKGVYFYGNDSSLDAFLTYINNGNMTLETNEGLLFLEGEEGIIFNSDDQQRMEIDMEGRGGYNIDPLSNVQFYVDASDYSYSLYGNNGRENASAYGVFGRADGNGTGSRFGVYGVATGSGAGTKYGVYGSASGSGTLYAGYFSGDVFCSGTYLPSDKNLKSNIQKAGSSMERILQLDVKTYQYDSKLKDVITLEKREQTGFLAQEVEAIFPELIKEVKHPVTITDETKDNAKEEFLEFKGINYVGLIPHLVNVAQEQQRLIEEQQKALEEKDQQMQELEQRLANIEAMLQQQSGTNNPAISNNSVTLTDATLEQNQPNPFSEATTIRYYIPKGVRNAVLRITNVEGKVLKDVAITSRGMGQTELQAQSLSAGTYFYTLVLDGKILETKRMVLTKQ